MYYKPLNLSSLESIASPVSDGTDRTDSMVGLLAGVAAAIANNFYGWGLMMHLDDLKGVRLTSQ
jgi:hypothetical protein